MRTLLQRYVLAECLPATALALGVFTLVLLMHRLLRLSDLVVAKGVPLWEVLRLLALALPGLLPILVPISLLLAVLLAMSRLSADSEIVAMRACGIGLGDNVKPILVLSTAIFALSLGVSLWMQPRSSRSFREALYESVKDRLSLMTQAGIFTELAEGVNVYADGLDDRTGVLTNLFLHLDRGPSKGVWIMARKGAIREAPGGLALDLQEGEMHQRVGPGKPYRWLRFESYRVRIPLAAEVSEPRGLEERPTLELARSSFGPGADRQSRLEFHRRLSLPASCLVFGFLGASLGLHHSRSGKGRGVSVCLAVLFVYYSLLTAGRALGERGGVPPEIAMWLPNGTLGAFALYAFVRKNREAPLPLEEALGQALRRLRESLRRRLRPEGQP
jgi:lipopolysaccharide export system permease protein